MSKTLQIVLSVAALSIAAFFALGTWLLWESRSIPLHVNGVLTRAEGVESKANATLINLDKGTAAWAAASKEQAQAVQDVMTQAQGTLSSADQTMASVRTDAEALHDTLTSTQKTADSATQSLDALTDTLGEGKRTIASLQPLVVSYTRAGDDLDAFLKSRALLGTVANLESTTGNFSLITYDLSRANHKFTEDYLSKRPWYKKAGQLTLDAVGFGLRHY